MKISFGSNYLINQGKEFPYKVIDNLYCLERQGVAISQEFTPFKEACETGIFSTIRVSSPDEIDETIETILLSNGIDFHKTSKEFALKPENIISRIQVDPYFNHSHSLVEIDVEKFDKLFKEDKLSYIEPQGTNGIGERYNNFVDYLKTNKPINASRVYVNVLDEEICAAIGDGRHRFAVLRDMGIKKLPVAMDETSIKNAKKFGLI